jgi:hypothetical protein
MRIEDAIKVVDRMLERNRINKDGWKRALAENKRNRAEAFLRTVGKWKEAAV